VAAGAAVAETESPAAEEAPPVAKEEPPAPEDVPPVETARVAIERPEGPPAKPESEPTARPRIREVFSVPLPPPTPHEGLSPLEPGTEEALSDPEPPPPRKMTAFEALRAKMAGMPVPGSPMPKGGIAALGMARPRKEEAAAKPPDAEDRPLGPVSRSVAPGEPLFRRSGAGKRRPSSLFD
jgi:hypothetical protein